MVDGRDGAPRRAASSSAPSLIDNVTPGMACTTTRSSGPVLAVVRVDTYDEGAASSINDNPYGNGTAIFTRDGGAARQFQFDVQRRHGRRQRADPGAGELLQLRRLEGALFGDTHMYGPEGINFYTRTKVVTSRWPDPAPARVDLGFPQDSADVSMDFGVVLQTNPPAWRVVELAKRAEQLRLQPRVDLRLPHAVAGAVRHLQPDPGRDPQGDRRADGDQPGHPRLDGHGRRCSPRSTRCTATAPSAASAAATRPSGSPTASRRRWPRCASAVHVIRELANGRERRLQGLARCASRGRPSSRLEVWVAAYGPKALALTGEVGDGFILQLADPDIAAWTIKAVRDGGRGGRARPGRRSRSAWPRRPTSATTSPTSATSAAGSAAWSATTSPTSSPATATDAAACPQALTDYIKGRAGLRLQRARPGRQHAHRRSCPTRSSTASASSARSSDHIERLDELKDARRRPVRDLPAARRQGRHTAGLRRARDPRHRRARAGQDAEQRRERTAVVCAGGVRCCSCSSLVLVAVRLGGLQGGRPGERRPGARLRILPRTNDLAMPHVCDILRRFGDPEQPRSAARSWSGRARGRRGTRSGWRSSGSSLGVAVGVGAGRRDGPLPHCVERGLLPYLVVSQTVPLIALAPLDRQLGRQAPRRSGSSGRGGCRVACSARSSRSSRSPSARCAGCSRRRAASWS